jgi:SAM-dependent methyltransferase
VHVQVYEWVSRHLPPSTRSVLEIGSLDVNGSLRELFPAPVTFHGIDLVAGPGVDEVADAAHWQTSRRYDLVLSTEVLEHAPQWERVLENAWAAVEPGGRVLVTCATNPRAPHSAVDGLDVRAEEHYRNVPLDEVEVVTRSWSPSRLIVEAHRGRGDLYLLADKHPRLAR